MTRESCASTACNNKTRDTGTRARGRRKHRSADRLAGWDSPVGVRGLVDDVLVGGEQQQPVLSEIHGHVGGAAASRLLLMERGARRGASPGAETAERGGDSSGRGRREPSVRDKDTATLFLGPSADNSRAAVLFQ